MLDRTHFYPEKIEYYENGNIHAGLLKDWTDIQVDNQIFKARAVSPVIFYTDGSVQKLILDAPAAYHVDDEVYVFGIELEQSLMLSFYPNGHIQWGVIGEDRSINVFGNPMEIESGTSIRFTEDGKITALSFPNPMVLSFLDEPFNHYSVTQISFSPDGKVENLSLGDFTKIRLLNDEMDFCPGEQIQYYESGEIKMCVFAEETDLTVSKNEFCFKPGWVVCFYKNGNVMNGNLGERTEYQHNADKFLLADSSLISFYENGNIAGISLELDCTVHTQKQILKVKAVANPFAPDVLFYPDGKLMKCFLAQDTDLELNGKSSMFSADTGIIFNTDGTVFAYETDKDRKATISGKTFLLPAYTWVISPEQRSETVEAIGFGADKLNTHLKIETVGTDLTFIKFAQIESLDDNKYDIDQVLYLQDTTIKIDDKTIECKSFQWAKVI